MPTAAPPRPHPLLRTATLVLALSLALAACGGPGKTGGLSLSAALPTQVPRTTTIVVGDPQTQVALRLSGELDRFTYPVEFANISGGPQTTEAFRADALDVGAVADIPPAHAAWTGLDVKIVAAKYRQDPLRHPIYELGVAPRADVDDLADLKGARIAYSPGQAQGALILRVLREAGLDQDDVDLVELPSTGDVYSKALASDQVDVAPLGGVQIKRYLASYGPRGGTTLQHGLRDDPSHLYVPVASLRDPAKAAAIREYVQHWAAAQRWIDAHPEEWIEGYYVRDQGLTRADGRWLVENAGHPVVPTDWSVPIAEHQKTVDLLAEEEDHPDLDASTLWDRRFERVGGDAFARAAAPS